MSEELAYSIHLCSDKNRTTKAKEIATDFSKKVKILDDINDLKNRRKKDNDFKGVWYYMSEEVKFVIGIIKKMTIQEMLFIS